MIGMIIGILKIASSVIIVITAYKSASYYKNRRKSYEEKIARDLARDERRRKAVEHFENL